MLFWIFVALFIACVVWAYATYGDGFFSVLFSVILGIVVGASTISIVCDHASADATIARDKQTYESLVYQYENNLYDNDNALGKKELMNQIQEWNENLAAKQKLQDNFWVGIYYPNIYDQFELIDLSQQ